MKTYLSTLTILLASLLVGCNESPVAATYTDPVSQDAVQSSSSVSDNDTVVIVVVTDPSSSSEDTTQSSSSVDVSSSDADVSSSTVSSSSTDANQTQFVAEFGYVPNGYNTDAITASNATQVYIRMNEIYTVKTIVTLGIQPRSETELLEWLDSTIVTQDSTLQDTVVNHIGSDLDEASASLRFYTRADGKFIFIYTEAYNDGIGLK